MANLCDSVVGLAQDSFTSSSSQLHPLGTRAYTTDGRRFRYVQAGAADLVAGNLIQSAATIPNHLATTATATAIGATSLTFTPGATAGASGLYAEGYLQVDTTPGNGYTYQVSGHPAIASSTALTVTLRDAIQVALTTSSRLGLIANPYKNVIVAATTATAKIVGVAGYIISATQYGWLNTWGACSTLINGTPAITATVVNGATTAGSVDVWTAAGFPTQNIVGAMMQVGVSTKNNFVFLSID